MEGIGVSAALSYFTKSEPGGPNELDSMDNLQAPDHGARAFNPGVLKQSAKSAGRNPNALGETFHGIDFSVVGGDEITRTLQSRMHRNGGIGAVRGANIVREAKQACSGERTHGRSKSNAFVIMDGEPFLDKEMN